MLPLRSLLAQLALVPLCCLEAARPWWVLSSLLVAARLSVARWSLQALVAPMYRFHVEPSGRLQQYQRKKKKTISKHDRTTKQTKKKKKTFISNSNINNNDDNVNNNRADNATATNRLRSVAHECYCASKPCSGFTAATAMTPPSSSSQHSSACSTKRCAVPEAI